ncbi:coiled-coil domain-containing protein 94 [Ditylenchus destructor]|uniref:Splicing factor YJU2 n=1 Tax=Ditylenchus destructor TaxID=166010 RepID=A0AAD4NJ96_9BILA|nr:coiled-coil domain-containing protein 94 [Ditylenchus destructor]
MTGTERKVFQKYYPPDFDPSKIPKAKGQRNRQFVQRVMAPFNMQCNTCHEYIYKGKKFNMRRETAEGESYLGMKIFRFYFRCPNCLAEITFKTDIENVDYKMEQGATRLFDAFKFYQDQERDKEKEEEEEKADAMKLLEKRTKMSKMEMEALGNIEHIQEANRRIEKVNAMEYLEQLDKRKSLSIAEQFKLQEEEDEREIRRLLGKNDEGKFERRMKDELDDDIGPGSSSGVAGPSSSSSNNISKSDASSSGISTYVKTAAHSSIDAKTTALSTASANILKPAPPPAKKVKPNFMNGVIVKKKPKES